MKQQHAHAEPGHIETNSAVTGESIDQEFSDNATPHAVAAAAIVLKNQLEQGLDGYNAHFKGAFGPFPAVKLYRTLSGLSTDYTDNLHNDELRSLAWIVKTGKSLSQALPECSTWWQAARRDSSGMFRHEDLDVVSELMKAAAVAVRQARELAVKHQAELAATELQEVSGPVSASLTALTSHSH